MNMKYETAYNIKSCVLALSTEYEYASICAAIRHRSDNDEEWEVCLYSLKDVEDIFYHFIVLADAICWLVPSLVFYDGQYDSGVYGEDSHRSVIIW